MIVSQTLFKFQTSFSRLKKFFGETTEMPGGRGGKQQLHRVNSCLITSNS